MSGLGLSRNYSIASALVAMKKLGTEVVLDFVMKCKMNNFMVENAVQAAILSDQDKWILSLPIAEVRENSPLVFDDLIIIRQPRAPILDAPDQGEHSEPSSSENCGPTGLEDRVKTLLAELADLQKNVEGYVDKHPEDQTF